MKDSKQYFCVFGRKPVIEAFRAGKRFDKILLQKNISSDEIREIQGLARQSETPTQNVPKEKIEAVARKYSKYKEANHQGVVGFLSIIEYYTVDDVLHHIYAKGETPLLLILDGVTDVGNFGAIARSAECLGAHALVIPAQGSALINAEAMKASAGALNKILVCREKSLIPAIKLLKANGIRIFGTDVKQATDISKADWRVPCAVVLGSEGEGLSKEVLKLCDESVSIPMYGSTESLNVSVSAGIILYEIAQKRNEG
jgi:23S rRNA (guanosine2251-2'-O)-methyltransferase